MYSNKLKATYRGEIKMCDTLPNSYIIEPGAIYYELNSNNIYTNINGVWELMALNYYTSTDINTNVISQKEEPIKSIELIKCPNCDAPLKIFTKGFHNCPYCNSSIHIS